MFSNFIAAFVDFNKKALWKEHIGFVEKLKQIDLNTMTKLLVRASSPSLNHSFKFSVGDPSMA